MTGCPHGMPSPGACTDCMSDDGLGAAPVTRAQPVLPEPRAAQFHTVCPHCGDLIEVGTPIMLFDDETWRHPRCY